MALEDVNVVELETLQRVLDGIENVLGWED
jgi:hypothetical protein